MEKPEVKYLKDYRPPAYWIDNTELNFDLQETNTLVKSVLNIRRNNDLSDKTIPLVLDGKNLELLFVKIDKKHLDSDKYQINSENLTIYDVPESFSLEVTTKIQPQNNTSLEGLYKAGGIFCTQCEAEGFRKITYFPDRPDVMSKYSCTITADREKYPILLSNGNLINSGMTDQNRHWAQWEDPFKKPSYLFALVAGDLVYIEDFYKTKSGRSVTLRIYVEHMNIDKCGHAMQSLKKAMKWDEDVFGLEYDLDIYMIVAVNDFNMGAMENKGLNIFNSKYVLAKPETATDIDFWNIERVIAHEYFHNWTGNRVTLKNWFQLSLKEGLTVFRDQEFSSDMTSRPVKRISDVRSLRSFQFPEDAGPMAHPVRPESYIEMDNFYTMTVYEKGAEIIRMIHRILGKQGFRKGMNLYFKRHDGQAVTTEDFVKAMEDANQADLRQFRLWYSQAGTPEISVKRAYNHKNKTYSMTFTQKCPPSPGMSEKKAMHIPVAVGLLDKAGNDMPLQLAGQDKPEGTTILLNLYKTTQTFEFVNVYEPPVPSILRGFSAPVKLRAEYTSREQAFLLANDSDEFHRWDSGQRFFAGTMINMVQGKIKNHDPDVLGAIIEPFRKTLLSTELDKAFISHVLTLPSESELGILISETAPIDPELIHQVRRFITHAIAKALKNDFERIYQDNQEKGLYNIDAESIARRSLKNLALSYLGMLETPEIIKIACNQFNKAENMTDEIAALGVLSHIQCSEREKAIDDFYQKWKSDTLVLDKWFAIQAGSQIPGIIDKIKELLNHPDFSIKNPNKVRALVSSFCGMNPWQFHHISGNGYKFMTDRILELNAINPQIAARMAGIFNHWKKYEPSRQKLMKAELEKIINTPDISRHVYEIVSKALV
ncbi:Aminopeptidase N [Desulfonema limicola]|uniref:Aminopeptidase N n=1 Tax=Desulfonema limicola TaxID=45656 RepID=A0A975BDS4_9BACT|nr:aminopeptidase N [Desulfonema limicola]QTA83662.1 Aminopeptidase N [Desulfonema limicola]